MSQWESTLINRERLFAMNDIKRFAKGDIELGDIMLRMDSLLQVVKEETIRLYEQDQREIEERRERMKPPAGYEGPWAG